MPFTAKPRKYGAAINETLLGTDRNAVALGGANVLPLHFFDNPVKNPPAVGVEITDTGFDTAGLPALAAYYDGAATPAERAKKAGPWKAPALSARFEGRTGGLTQRRRVGRHRSGSSERN